MVDPAERSVLVARARRCPDRVVRFVTVPTARAGMILRPRGLGGRTGIEVARLLFDLVPDGLWVFDDDAVTTWANDRMAELLGRDPAEMVGLSVRHPRRAGPRGLRPRAATDGPHRAAAGRRRPLLHPAGRHAVWGSISFRPVLDGDRRIGWLQR